MKLRRRMVLAIVTMLLAAATGRAAQLDPAEMIRALLYLPGPQAWLLTTALPDRLRFCATKDADGTLRGCITAKELRVRADMERNTRKGH